MLEMHIRTDCVEYQPAGTMGYHFQNNAPLDTTLDVEHPEVLVYERDYGRETARAPSDASAPNLRFRDHHHCPVGASVNIVIVP
jgi:hypothetical protein